MSLDKSGAPRVTRNSNFSNLRNESKEKKKPNLLWEKYDAPYVRICRAIIWILDYKMKKPISEDLHCTIDGYLIRMVAEVNLGNLETFVKRHNNDGIDVDRNPFTNRINFIKITKNFEVYLRNAFKPVKEA